ncbi:unnamed protein product [Adineta steineri]|uniref:EGF-like domain-containing protein n=1 Tax=Adineta steineri TaxID=433720 RepID=A0A819WAC4_9BILA|nr:unnamed protein product [Adineta steineri]
MCLPADQVTNGIVSCFVASSDEFQNHQVNNITFQTYRFRCWNDTKCKEQENLCNENEDCPMYDNELFCDNHPQLCHDFDFGNLIDMQYISCQIINTHDISFSLETAVIYPPTYTIPNNPTENPINNKMIEAPLVKSFSQPEICNSGLYVYHRLGIDNYTSICFCPPNYYGDRCQYQNQRVSLTLVLASVDQPIVYAIVVTLMEDDNDTQEIHSHHQITYESKYYCGQTVNIYLLYTTREKNNSKNYSICIDVFNKDSLTYLTSWHLTIPFIFLPVNRMSAFLTLPISGTLDPENCTLQCYKGTCMKYHNEERFFCQCNSGWSGAQCHIPIDCSMCASNSICIGSIRNRSVCVCPYGKFGSFCRLQLFRMVIVKIDNRYYLAVLRKLLSSNIVTSISPAQRCVPIHELLPTKLLSLPRIQRLKSYHIPCQHDFNLQCFVDEFYMCLCTEEHHSNCFPLEHSQAFACKDNVYCENGGTCLQDQRICGEMLCVCVDCFSGSRCQFYAKGIGLTLDDLLRYEIRPNNTLNDQSLVIKLSATLIMIIFLIGTVNGFLSYLVFHDRDSRKYVNH